MKLKIRLSIMVIGILAVVVTGIAILLVREASNISIELSKRGLGYLTDQQAEYWNGRLNGHIRMLTTLAEVMADYQDKPVETRRDLYDSMLLGTMTSNSGLMSLYMVWKPNAVDGMDEHYIGRPGSSPTGQYAVNFTRETGEITVRASTDIDAAMVYINGPNARKDRVENPFSRVIAGRNTYVFRMMVPIISARTNEVVGGVGCLMTIEMVQPTLEEIIRTHDEITAMAIYSRNGFIIAHLYPDRIGRMLTDVEAFYGQHLQPINQAVRNGDSYACSVYSRALNTRLEIDISPFTIGNSDFSWSVMIAASEDYILTEVRAITMFTIILAAIAIIISAVIIYFKRYFRR
jgi:methyl-accepting chemotaxis protein